jgi:hypothetical protein
MDTLDICPGPSRPYWPMLIYVCCVRMFFLIIKHWFCWKYQYNKYIFKFIDIYSFIPVSGCVGMDPSALLYPGIIMLQRRPWVYMYPQEHICKFFLSSFSDKPLNLIYTFNYYYWAYASAGGLLVPGGIIQLVTVWLIISYRDICSVMQ